MKQPKPKNRDEFLAQQVRNVWPTLVYPIDIAFAEEFNQIHGLGSTYKFADKGLVGLEVEVENIKRIDPNLSLCYWIVEEDGSLRNNGREFKTKGAVRMQYAEAALMQLFNGLNSDLEFSVRTSIHVHQNVRSMRLDQLLTLIFLYVVMENLLFVFAGSNRRNSIYCVPIFDTALMEMFNDLDNFVSHIRDGGEGYLEHTWPKYSAINLLPVSKFGSLEFRQFPGTTNIHKILVWLDLISRLKIWAYRTPMPKALEIINALNTNSSYHALVTDVFGDLTQYLDLTSLPALMEKNVSLIKNITIVNDFHKLLCRTPTESTSMFNTLFRMNPPTVWNRLSAGSQKWLMAYANNHNILVADCETYIKQIWSARGAVMSNITSDSDRIIFQRILDRCAELLA